MSLSAYNRAHVSEILAGHGDWFSAQLLRLIAKADGGNREKLRQVFPEHVAAYESYMLGEEDDSA